jgi:hypothetical protein
MNAVDLVKACLTAVEKGDEAALDRLLSPTFVYMGMLPSPAGREGFIEAHVRLLAAFEDLSLNPKNIQEKEPGVVTATIRLSGTHTGTLITPLRGLAPVPPTRKKVLLPEEQMTCQVSEGYIEQMVIPRLLGGGLVGILLQLGVRLPL